MSDYVLIKDYNSAYRPWIRAVLKKKRIMGDREYSWKEAQQISLDMAARGVDDRFFRSYFLSWRDHPEHPPDYFDLLCMALPIYKDGKLDFTELTKLDLEARSRSQKIIFTIEDAAKDIYDFYDLCLTKPLARDLERCVKGERHARYLEGKAISRYFEFDEQDRIPDVRVHTEEQMEQAENDIAVKLLQWLRTITPEKILDDIKQTLDEHYNKGLAAASPESSYNHKSEYVRISAHRERGIDTPATTFLTPARNYSAIKEGYEGVYYPMYYVELAP